MLSFALVAASLLPSVVWASHCGPATAPDTDEDQLGPYFIKDVPYKGFLFAPQQRLDGEERLTVSGHILNTDCAHIPCAEVDAWGTDPNGGYSFQHPYWGRGRIQADADGFYQFQTWYPAYYPEGVFPWSFPKHIHFAVTAPAQSTFVTQMYFCTDERSADAWPSTRVTPTRAANGVDWEVVWDIVLPDISNAVVAGMSTTCAADSGVSAATETSMTADEQIDAEALQGSPLFLNEAITVTAFPSGAAPTTTWDADPTLTCSGGQGMVYPMNFDAIWFFFGDILIGLIIGLVVVAALIAYCCWAGKCGENCCTRCCKQKPASVAASVEMQQPPAVREGLAASSKTF